jgi:hypothetical protein
VTRKFFIEDYDDSMPCVETSHLKAELEKLREIIKPGIGAISGHPTWSDWRYYAGMVEPHKKDKNADPIPTGARFATQRQAAKIVLQALWKPKGATVGCVQQAIGDDLLVKTFGYKLKARNIEAKYLNTLFDLWIQQTNGAEAGQLLATIRSAQSQLTGKNLSDISEMLPPGKRVPVSNFNRLVTGLGETVRSNSLCSRKATKRCLTWLWDRAVRSQSQELQQN